MLQNMVFNRIPNQFKLGPLQLTINARGSGVRGSISIPGTGLSKRNIKLF